MTKFTWNCEISAYGDLPVIRFEVSAFTHEEAFIKAKGIADKLDYQFVHLTIPEEERNKALLAITGDVDNILELPLEEVISQVISVCNERGLMG